VSWS